MRLKALRRGVALRFDNVNGQCVKLCFKEIIEGCKTTKRMRANYRHRD